MSFVEIMNNYFQGEKLEALYYILPAGLLVVGLGITAIRVEQGGFAWGIGVPAIIMGLVLIATGVGVGTRTDNQVAQLEQQYHESPAIMVEQELPRMEKVVANFHMTYWIFGALVVLGLGLHYFAGPNLGRGMGATLILLGAIGLLVDGFAERRAEPYTEALQQIAIEHSSQKGD